MSGLVADEIKYSEETLQNLRREDVATANTAGASPSRETLLAHYRQMRALCRLWMAATTEKDKEISRLQAQIRELRRVGRIAS